jgi:two-component system chemotaxis response regulator CheB
MTVACREVRRVLICDDSQTYAAGLARLLSRDPEIEVVGVCTTAEEAIARLTGPGPKPHIVTMDLELPGMSGATAIEQIMSVQPVPILVLAGGVERGSRTALATLGAGALDVLSKDGLDLSDPGGPDALVFRERVKLLSDVHVMHHPRAVLRGPPATGAAGPAGGASVVGICASAGGPQALASVLAEVPATFAIPILLVQHISPGFIAGFARWLDDQVPLAVRLAEPGRTYPGIWVAPEGAHLVLAGARRLGLEQRADAGPHRPSANVLLHSIALHAGSESVAVVLTGMGRDGADGLGAVRRAGGLTIAQDEASSTVFGMPMAAIECGAEFVLGPADIGRRLARLRVAERVS